MTRGKPLLRKAKIKELTRCAVCPALHDLCNHVACQLMIGMTVRSLRPESDHKLRLDFSNQTANFAFCSGNVVPRWPRHLSQLVVLELQNYWWLDPKFATGALRFLVTNADEFRPAGYAMRHAGPPGVPLGHDDQVDFGALTGIMCQ